MRNLLCLPLLHKLMLGIESLRCWSARDKQKILGYTLDAANYYVFSSPLGHLQTFYTILSALFTLCYFHSAWPILCFHSAWFSLPIFIQPGLSSVFTRSGFRGLNFSLSLVYTFYFTHRSDLCVKIIILNPLEYLDYSWILGVLNVKALPRRVYISSSEYLWETLLHLSTDDFQYLTAWDPLPPLTLSDISDIVNDGVDGGMGVSAKDDAVKYCNSDAWKSYDSPPETQTLRLLPDSWTTSYKSSHKI